MRSRDAPIRFDWLNGDVRELRDLYERAYGVEDRGAHEWKAVELGERRIRVLVQSPVRLLNSDCLILYFHGGGWIVGSPLTHADISRALCERTGMRVVSVDYRLAPEHVAPAPVDDGLATLRHVLADASSAMRVNSAMLCGDSAGAAIALAVERHAGSGIRGGILGVCSFYGFFGLVGSASLEARGCREAGLDQACVSRMWSLAHAPGSQSPYSVESLGVHSCVPAYLLAASDDPLVEDTLRLAAGFSDSGRQHILDKVEHETHGFLHRAGTSERAWAAIQRVSDWMRVRVADRSDPEFRQLCFSEAGKACRGPS